MEDEKIDPNYAITLKLQPCSEERMTVRRKSLAKFLNARCKGLLEVHCDCDITFTFAHKIEFLHRTVRDFLMSPAMVLSMKARSPRGFDPATYPCHAHLALLKETQSYERKLENRQKGVLDARRDIIYYARVVELEHHRCEENVLDELDRLLATGFEIRSNVKPFSRPHKELDGWDEVVNDSLGFIFVRLAVQEGLVLYVERRLADDPSLMHPPSRPPLLLQALELGDLRDGARNLDPEMASMLLRRGAEPNERMGGFQSCSASVWVKAVQGWGSTLKLKLTTDVQKHQVFKTILVLLEARADPWVLSDRAFPKEMTTLQTFELSKEWNLLSTTQARSILEVCCDRLFKRTTERDFWPKFGWPKTNLHTSSEVRRC